MAAAATTTTTPSRMETARIVLTNRDLQKAHPEVIIMLFSALACLAFGLSFLIGGIICLTNDANEDEVFNMGLVFIALGVLCLIGLGALVFILWTKRNYLKSEVPRFTRSVRQSVRRSFRQVRSSMRRRPNPAQQLTSPANNLQASHPQQDQQQQQHIPRQPLPANAPEDMRPPWTITGSGDHRFANTRPRQGIVNENYSPEHQQPLPIYDSLGLVSSTPVSHHPQQHQQHQRSYPPQESPASLLQQRQQPGPYQYRIAMDSRGPRRILQPAGYPSARAPAPPVPQHQQPVMVMQNSSHVIWTSDQSIGV